LRIDIPSIRSAPPLTIPPIPPRVGPETAGAARPFSADPLPVPSCLMLSTRQIDNFALSDLDGQPWEFRRDHRGRLMLLDFWYTDCPPCRRAIPHLNELHQAYRDRGLEVIGIACEQHGTADQRVHQVVGVQRRLNVAYRLLMNGDRVLPNGERDELRRCPLVTQLGISAYPTLKLIDERGQIVWESVGLDEGKLSELKSEIERRLPMMR
jgi:thiol-disulfide isomerase/thioredoxin